MRGAGKDKEEERWQWSPPNGPGPGFLPPLPRQQGLATDPAQGRAAPRHGVVSLCKAGRCSLSYA